MGTAFAEIKGLRSSLTYRPWPVDQDDAHSICIRDSLFIEKESNNQAIEHSQKQRILDTP